MAIVTVLLTTPLREMTIVCVPEAIPAGNTMLS